MLFYLLSSFQNFVATVTSSVSMFSSLFIHVKIHSLSFLWVSRRVQRETLVNWISFFSFYNFYVTLSQSITLPLIVFSSLLKGSTLHFSLTNISKHIFFPDNLCLSILVLESCFCCFFLITTHSLCHQLM